MKRLLAGGLVTSFAFLLAACGGSSSNNNDDTGGTPPPPPAAQVQVVHASADAPAVDVLLNGAVPDGLAGVPFAVASPYLELDPGAVDVAVNALLPDGSGAGVLSADAPAVCVVADDASTEAVERIELFAGVPFRAFGYLGEIPPGNYLVGLEVFDDQTGCAGTTAVTFDDAVEFAPGAEATGIVAGGLGNGTLELLALADDLRSIATEARVRIVHGSALTPAVDIYVVAAGTDITDPDVAPAFSDVEFRGSTGFVPLLPGEYDVFVTLAGDTTPAITVAGLALDGGEVISAIASDPVREEVVPGLIVIDHVALKSPSL